MYSNFKEDFYRTEKLILEENKVMEKAKSLKAKGKKIGLCTGSFDLLHPGHITHLNSAKKFCDVLFVGIANDSYSSSKNSESGRPVFPALIRAYMISNLKSVDFVFYEDGTPHSVDVVKPDFFIKGIDYAEERDPGILMTKKKLKQFGGEVIYTRDEKLSTTEIIKHIKENIS